MFTGVTGAPIIGDQHQPSADLREKKDVNEITKKIIGLIQLATAAEKHAKTLLTVLEALQSCIHTIPSRGPQHETMKKTGQMLLKRLGFIAQKTEILIHDVQHIEKRAQAQLTAVREHPNLLLRFE